MSFILDALKKSENERQQQSSAEFSSVPTSSSKPGSLRWLWLLGALLAINLIVLTGLLMRPDTQTASPPAPAAAIVDEPGRQAAPAIETTGSFAEQVAKARQDDPPPATSETRPVIKAQPAPATASSRVPTIDELLLDGSIQLAQLHVDIHVYSDTPDERFVFINMVKHREQSQLAEGPVVTEITPDGVILRHQGRTFLLPRE